jgi:serine/threonine protein phosphatase PrpC
VIAIRSAAESHTGYVRTNNEDLAVISSDLAAIADGMGGHLGGEVAARTAIEELVEAFQRDRTAAGLVAAVRMANRAIWRRSRVDRKLRGMGTTLTATALLRGDGEEAPAHLALVNVGDSRAYKLDSSGGNQPRLIRMTEDHSVVEEMVRQGELTPAEAAVHPHRNVVTRALGIDSEVDVDVWDLEPVPGTRYLLCTDGLSDEVPESDIARVLAGSEDPHEAAKELVGLALAHGGIDNVTVVVTDIVDAAPGSVVQPLEMVPARLPPPDRGDDRLGADITQALPITRARRRRIHSSTRSRGEPGAGEVAGAAAAAAEAAAAGAVAEPASGTAAESEATVGSERADDGPAAEAEPTEAQATEALSPSAMLYDAEEDAGAPGSDGGSPGSTGGAPGAAEPTARTDLGAAETAVSDHRAGETPQVSGNGVLRSRRSMTVRGTAPAASGRDPVEQGTASHQRGTVLVPTKHLSKQYRDRVVTFRVFLFFVLLAALIGGIIAVVIWFQRSSYFVGLDGNRVSIYAGRPGGTMWFKPQLVGTTSLTTNELLPNSVVEVRSGITESTYAAAKQEVDALIRLSSALHMYPSHTSATHP